MLAVLLAVLLLSGKEADSCSTDWDCGPALVCRAMPGGRKWCVAGCLPGNLKPCPGLSVCLPSPGRASHLPAFVCKDVRDGKWLP